MTRVEKYQAYREEIAKSAKLGKSIVDSDEDVNKYQKQINKLNSAILTSVKDESLSLEKGVIEIDVKDKQVPEDVTNLFNTLNQTTIVNQSEQINNYFHNKINLSILNDKKEIDPKWLASNSQYSQGQKIGNNVTNSIAEEKVFVDDLTNKYNNMSQASDIAAVDKLQKVTLEKQSNKIKNAMLAVSITIITMIVVMLVLIIIKGVKG